MSWVVVAGRKLIVEGVCIGDNSIVIAAIFVVSRVVVAGNVVLLDTAVVSPVKVIVLLLKFLVFSLFSSQSQSLWKLLRLKLQL